MNRSAVRARKGPLLHKPKRAVGPQAVPSPSASASRSAVRHSAVVLGVALATVTTLLGGLYGAYAYAIGHPLLRIERIDVEGSQVLREEEVIALAGVRKNAPILSVDLAEVERRLEANPRIRRAEVLRHLPRRLELVIEERTPVLMVRSGQSIMGLDADGVPFPLLPSAEQISLPVLIPAGGLSVKTGQPLPAAAVSAAIEAGAALKPDLESRVAEIRIEEDGGVLLFLVEGTRVRLGKSGLAERVGRLRTALALMDARGERKDWIDLRFARIVTRP